MVDVPVPGVPAGVVVRGRFEVLRVPTYRVLWSSGVCMFFAIQAQQIARSWLAIELTGTNAGIGGVFLAFGVPMLLFAPMGGVLADRFAKRTVLMVCQAAILGGAVVISLAVELHVLEYWMLLAASAVHGAGMAVLAPTRMAYTGELVERGLLANAVVLQQIVANGTRIIGPAIAGALIGIEAIGAGGVYILTSVMILVALSISRTLPRAAPKRTTDLQSPFRELADGIRYLRSRRPVMQLMVVSVTVAMIGFVYMAFLPSLARDIFDVGSSGYGFMSMAGAVGGLATSMWVAGRVSHKSIWRMQAVCGTAFGVAILLLGLAPAFVVALAALLIVGGAGSGFQATNSSLVLTETELAYHGRMQSLMMPGFAASGIVAFPMGMLADSIGLRETLVLMGAAIIAVMGCYAVARRRYLADEASAAREAELPA